MGGFLKTMLMAKLPVIVWIEKIFYGLLILCVGGVGPLIYFDAFLPDHPHPYHLSVLHETFHEHAYGDNREHTHPHSCQSQRPEQDLNRRPVERLTISPHLITVDFISPNQSLASGLVRFFQSGLSHGYLLIVAKFDISVDNSLSNRVSLVTLTEPSVWLPPPEKPPPSLSLS